jgi:leucyl/phenylalanyl-tRNA--protein transferase
MYALDDKLWFPRQDLADDEGLLAIGGDLRPERLLLAYANGIFPWFNEEDPILWWCPDPRFVMFPDKLKISKSMKQVLRRGVFEFRYDRDFEGVIRNCAGAYRGEDVGTWITEEMIRAYLEMHRLGFAHSAESWQDGVLVGGLYGVRLGNMFFGESMFSTRSNASKAAYISLVEQLRADGVQLIDCQMHTPHLESLGAEYMARTEFLSRLRKLIPLS